MAECIHCSKPLPPDSGFCVNCGEPVVPSPLAQCSGCRKPIPSGCRFCIHCGQALPEVKTDGHQVKPVEQLVSPPRPSTPPVEPAPIEAAPLPSSPGPTEPRLSSTTPPQITSRALGSSPAKPNPASKGCLLALALSGLALVATAMLVIGGLWIGYSRFIKVPSLATSSPSPQTTPALPTKTTASPIADPTANQSPQNMAQPLQLMIGLWSVDPSDPLYQAGRQQENELSLKAEGISIVGSGPDKSSLHFSWRDGQIVGEGKEPDGKTHRLRWQWILEGQKAKLSVTQQGREQSVTLIKGQVQTVSARPSHASDCLYRKQADLNGDGSSETVEVIVLEDNLQPNAATPKVLKILSASGSLLFQSEKFEEPFRTDLDSIAEAPDQVCGLHLIAGNPYPRIRLIFTPRSGNFVDFGYDGKEFGLAGLGD